MADNGTPRRRRFVQVDVFGVTPLRGNPVAVVVDGEDLDDETMLAIARWTNLSETTFLTPGSDAGADYAVRIFTPGGELPFAGHPTLGSCHAWLGTLASVATGAAGAAPPERIVQECGVGLVELRRQVSGRLAFAAPPCSVAEIDEPLLDRIVAALGVDRADVDAARILDNGPGWHVLFLRGAELVLALRPDFAALAELPKVGVVGPHQPGSDALFELRAFAPGAGVPEDPVTGSLNAAAAQWLVAEGRAPASYVATQGLCVGRDGQIHIAADGDGVWIGGSTATVIEGTIDC